jgi:hypothetical protein
MRLLPLLAALLLFTSHLSFAVTDRPLAPLAGAVISPPPGSEFTFAVFGDFRQARRDRPYPRVFSQMLREVKLVGPAFAVSTGDAYYGYGGSFQRFMNEVEYFLSEMKSLEIPVFNAPGNHEVTDEPERERYVRERFGELYGSFDVGTVHFIVLNTEEKGSEGAISGDQLRWLERDLDANRDATHVFVFLHRPLLSAVDPEFVTGKSFRDKKERDALHALFDRYKVRIVFAGHEHLYSDTVRDGVRYIIAGGGGSPLYRPADEGGLFHYIVVKVAGTGVSVNVLQPYSIEVRSLAGNDGFGSRAEVEVTNLSSAHLSVKNISLLMPRADAERYRVRALSIPSRGALQEHPARIGNVKDNGNGTAAVAIETLLPGNSVIRVSAELDE